MDWFLYDRDLSHEIVKETYPGLAKISMVESFLDIFQESWICLCVLIIVAFNQRDTINYARTLEMFFLYEQNSSSYSKENLPFAADLIKN